MYFVWFGWLLLLPVWVVVTSHLTGRPLPWGWLGGPIPSCSPSSPTSYRRRGVRASPRSCASWPGRWCLRPGWSRSPSGGCARVRRPEWTEGDTTRPLPRWRRPWAPTLDGNPVVWRECHRQTPSRWTRIVWGLYGVLVLALSVQAFVMMMPWAACPASGCRCASTSVRSPSASCFSPSRRPPACTRTTHGSLDVLLATPLPTATIVRGKWCWAFRRVPLLALLPTVMTLLLTAVGRWAGPLLIMALILSQGAAVTSLGLALATWSRRAGRAPAPASACLGMSLGWPVLILFLFADAPRDDWFPYWVMMGSPVASTAL